MIATYNIEWLNSNNLRSYPFKEDSRSDLHIPNDILVDAQIVIPYAKSGIRILLKSIIKSPNGIFISLKDSDDRYLGSCIIPEDDPPYTIYTLNGADSDYDGCIIRLVSGTRSTDMLNGIIGTTSEKLEDLDVEFESDVIRPALREVTSVSLVTDEEVTDKLTGDITLVAGDNIIFTVENNTITINAVSTSDLEEDDCDCDDVHKNKRCIYTINNIPPDDDGNFKMEAGTCIAIDGDSGLIISDICSEPCCGCSELEKISESYKILDSSINRVASNVSRLAEEQSTLYSKYILTLFRQYMEWL